MLELINNVNPAVLVIATILITVALVKLGGIVKEKRSQGQSYEEAINNSWVRLRPIIDDLVAELMKLNASQSSYEATLSYSVKYIKQRINDATWILPIEKDMLSEDLIKKIIDPYLKELYTKKQLTKPEESGDGEA